MLVGAFQIKDVILAAVGLALGRKVFTLFQHEGMGGATVEPDIQNVGNHVPLVGLVVVAQETLPGTVCKPGVGTLRYKGIVDALVDGFVLQDFRGVLVLRKITGFLERQECG